MTGRCSDCTYFENDAASVEAAFPGLASLSSAYSSVRADAGCASDMGSLSLRGRGVRISRKTAKGRNGDALKN